ncbi:hypothetical protein [Tenacibaculum maritimum]|uniref:hypothetical protein n=1 Tax=Tenacibaculum maritimum TaxID=107401 RepID=UPI003876939E
MSQHIYHRVKINAELLELDKLNTPIVSGRNPLESFLRKSTKTTLPEGKCIGVTWNPYPVKEVLQKTIQEGRREGFPPPPPPPPPAPDRPSSGNPNGDSTIKWSQTDIIITDSKTRKITTETDVSDFRHKGGGHLIGFKNIKMENDADSTIKIEWQTLGEIPICGEFVFLIEEENCECP